MRVCVVVTARASWAKLQSICRALKPRCELTIVCCASAMLERYGDVAALVDAEFPGVERVYSVLEGATLETTAIEVGMLQDALSRTYARLRPDVVVVCADRREILAAAAAARMQNIPIAHCQGGEHSGSVDDDIRDAVTQLATFHFTCTTRAKMRVYALTGEWERLWNFGCSSIDLAQQAQRQCPVTAQELGGAGRALDPQQPFVLVLQHPVTTHADQAEEEITATLQAAFQVAPHRVLVLWPGEEAGHDAMSKVIRMQQQIGAIHTVRNLPPARFLRLLTQASVLVGNSSAGIREASYLGVPVVNVGDRQQGRERGPNVIDVPVAPRSPCPGVPLGVPAIVRALEQQMAHGPYESSPLYGDGHAGERIAEILTR